MKPEIAYTDLKTSADDMIITDARQLALEKWMEAVTVALRIQPHLPSECKSSLNEAFEEYKRVSKP